MAKKRNMDNKSMDENNTEDNMLVDNKSWMKTWGKKHWTGKWAGCKIVLLIAPPHAYNMYAGLHRQQSGACQGRTLRQTCDKGYR